VGWKSSEIWPDITLLIWNCSASKKKYFSLFMYYPASFAANKFAIPMLFSTNSAIVGWAQKKAFYGFGDKKNK
jgi:hypothetical protein